MVFESVKINIATLLWLIIAYIGVLNFWWSWQVVLLILIGKIEFSVTWRRK